MVAFLAVSALVALATVLFTCTCHEGSLPFVSSRGVLGQGSLSSVDEYSHG